MKKQILFMLSLVTMVLMMASCDQPSLVGTWKAKSADVRRIMGDLDVDNVTISNCKFELNFTESILTQKADFSAVYSEDGLSVNMDMVLTVKYEYTHEGDLIKLKYVTQKCDVKDVSFDEEIEEALEAAGITKSDLKKQMLAEMKEEESLKEDASYIIKSLETNKMSLEDEEGVMEYVRVN